MEKQWCLLNVIKFNLKLNQKNYIYTWLNFKLEPMTQQTENNILDNPSANYTFHRAENQSILILKVKTAPLIIRSVYFFFTVICFLFPILMIVLNIAAGNGLQIGYFISILIFGLMGFFLLRSALWNTFGQEVIVFNTYSVNYQPDYGKFKGNKKEIKNENINFTYRKIGFEDEQIGNLVIANKEDKIETVVKLAIDQLKELINDLEKVQPK